MEEQQTKRSYFVPVLLLLLVLSLTGNMLLGSKQVYQKQEDRAQRGLTIIDAGNQAKQHIDAVLAGLDELGSSDISRRLAAKGALGAAFKQADDARRFISEAEVTNGKPFTFAKRDALTFFGQTEQSLLLVANHDGPLTAQEQAYLQTVKQVYGQMKGILAPFDYKTASKDIGLTVQAGGAWVDMAKKLLDAMNGPDSIMYSPKQQ